MLFRSDVTSCFMGFGKDTIYGNLNDASLEEIWSNSEELKRLREEHRTYKYRDLCGRCYARSATNFHLDLYRKSIVQTALKEKHGNWFRHERSNDVI